jgi:hypothetical protein
LDRAAYLAFQKASFADEKHWWNKLTVLTDDEINLLPHGFLKKYGSHLHAIKRMQVESHHEENLRF